jgi:hypothetical protein
MDVPLIDGELSESARETLLASYRVEARVRAEHPGDYVAVLDGRVIGSDRDLSVLARRIRATLQAPERRVVLYVDPQPATLRSYGSVAHGQRRDETKSVATPK